MGDVTRRGALITGLAGSAAACATPVPQTPLNSLAGSTDATFSCGVASGDPATTSVVLWTRIAGVSGGNVPVIAEVADDDSFARIVLTEKTEAAAANDHTVKVIATGLEPGKRYAYRFRVFDRVSPAGFTKTLPEETDRARFAVVSCSNYPFGFFNAYDHIARQTDLDAVLHLGDYIYEYGPQGYGGKTGAAIGREHQPSREIVSLEDYRQRHRQYKSDPALQAMHAAHPMIAIWDDHEVTNDSFAAGAENHQPQDEGDWNTRKRAALQAYFDYMPVREPRPGRGREDLYRHYRWGNYLTLPILESRLAARSKPVDYEEVVPRLKTEADIEEFLKTELGDESRELLGAAQLAWLDDVLAQSAAAGDEWRVLGNQTIMARIIAPDLGAYMDEDQIAELEERWPIIRSFLAFSELGLPLNLDAWDGYPAARERFYQLAEKNGARDLVVLTGDTHQFWANDLVRDDGTAMGVELGTASITSPAASAYLGEKAFDYSLLLRRDNADIRYTDPESHGYILLSFEEDRGHADYMAVSTILEPSYTARTAASFDLKKDGGTVRYAKPRGLGFKERVLF